MTVLSRENRIYLAIWRKALRDKDTNPLTINCSSFKIALRQRVGFYRVIRPYRNGEAYDSELATAAEQVVPTLSPKSDGPATITFLPRKSLELAEAIFADLGLDDSDLLSQEELDSIRAADQALGTLMPPRANPFYTRGS